MAQALYQAEHPHAGVGILGDPARQAGEMPPAPRAAKATSPTAPAKKKPAAKPGKLQKPQTPKGRKRR
jgi:hypothetical protein